MLEQEIAEFGRRMGLPSLALDANGLVALQVEGMGQLHLEKRVDNGAVELLLYLARPCPAHAATVPERALALCHYRHAHALPLSAGMYKEQLLLLTRLDERESTAASMEKAVLLLADIMNTIMRGI